MHDDSQELSKTDDLLNVFERKFKSVKLQLEEIRQDMHDQVLSPLLERSLQSDPWRIYTGFDSYQLTLDGKLGDPHYPNTVQLNEVISSLRRFRLETFQHVVIKTPDGDVEVGIDSYNGEQTIYLTFACDFESSIQKLKSTIDVTEFVKQRLTDSIASKRDAIEHLNEEIAELESTLRKVKTA